MPEPSAFAVVGAPVLHSASPRLFSAAFQKLGMDAVYTRLAVRSADEAVRLARGIGLRGFNVTAPFKEDMARSCDVLDATSARLGAVNTVLVSADGLSGFNTDSEGVVAALSTAGIEPAGKSIVVLGAGGAAKAAAHGLCVAGAAEVTILGRDEAKARSAAALCTCGFGSLAEVTRFAAGADILISCLPPQASPVAMECLRPGLAVLDANYHAPQLAQAAAARGCEVVRGGNWLVRQAERAFQIFTGVNTPAGAMAAAFENRGEWETVAPARVALTGLSGAGKSTLGPLLATRLGCALWDTDAMVEAAAHATTRESFGRHGEREFRRLERAAVAWAMGEQGVVALGGGALLAPENLARVASCCLSVWLWTEPRIALQRVTDGSRPLLESEADVDALLAARLPGYLRAADLVIATDRDEPEVVAKRIADEVHRAFRG